VSSHSLLWLPQAPDYRETVRRNSYLADFVLASREAKLPYVRLQLEAVGALDARTETELGLPGRQRGWLGVGGEEIWRAIPALAREVARWVLLDGVAVVGNRDVAGHKTPGALPVGGIDPSEFGNCLVRQDPLGFWTLLSDDGLKLRLSFSEAAPPRVRPFRTTWPERVELTITDRCEVGCKLCYRDSRSDGAHARFEDVDRRLDELAEARVMEVVLGGGEPTGHPQFSRIVKKIQRQGMRAAFTTRRPDWFKRAEGKPRDWAKVRWAFSIDRAHDVERVLDVSNAPTRPAIHVVLGTEVACANDLLDVAHRCQRSKLQLVLLGFKRTGRGGAAEPQDDAHWLETCASARLDRVCIDSALARKYEFELERRGMPDWLRDVDDCRYSMHVDAVHGTCGPSSYCPPEEMFEIPDVEDPIKVAFDRIGERQGPARLRRELELEQVRAKALGDEARQVLLDAAMEGRCEKCGASEAEPVGGERGRPSLLCARCRLALKKLP
jgi:hypothetical protein